MDTFFKKMMVVTLFMVGFQSGLSATTPDADLKDILKEMTSLQGDFHQKVFTEKGKILQESHGKMWLKKPAQFRWEVQGNDPRIVVANGQKVWDYDKDLEQVTIQEVTQGYASAPIFFLTGDTHSISKDFQINAMAANNQQCMSNSDQCFLLKPKVKQGAFQWIRIGFKNKSLKELELLDQLGQQSIFLFDHIVLNRDISPKQFQFIPPANTDVVSH